MEIANSSVSFQTDHDLYEYLLVAYPDAEVNEKLVAEKKNFHALHDHEMAIKTKPHLTVANFLMKEPMEEIIINWIQNICRLQTSFTVTLNNFSGLPPHTIYVRIQNPQPFQKLANALKILDGFFLSSDCPSLQLVMKPHLAIAAGLPEPLYHEAIKKYARKSFHACFTVNKLFLLKRDEQMKYHLVNTFILPPR